MLCNYDVLSASNKTGRLNAFNVLKEQTISNGNKKQNVEIHVNENIHVHQFKKQKKRQPEMFWQLAHANNRWHNRYYNTTCIYTSIRK